MSVWNYDTLAAQYRDLCELLSHKPNEPESICVFRQKCCALLEKTTEDPAFSQDQKMCKLGMEIAAEISATRVREERGDGCLITRPDPCPEDLRKISVRVYDECLSSVRSRDNMYIPPRIERSAPDAERSLSALRRHDLQKAQKNAERQASNKEINRLFGRRR